MHKILVIDDSPTMRHLITFTLKRNSDISITEATDGLDAIGKLSSETFSLIITDIHMPVMDGLKLIEHLRSNPLHRDLPIIIITTEDERQDKERALSLGATTCITKPIKGHELMDTVNQLLAL